MEKIPLGTQYATMEDMGINDPTPTQELNLLMANTSIDYYCSTMTYYDENGEIPQVLKMSAKLQFQSIENGEVELEGSAGSFSIGSWSETNDSSMTNGNKFIDLGKLPFTLLSANGYLYRGNVVTF